MLLYPLQSRWSSKYAPCAERKEHFYETPKEAGRYAQLLLGAAILAFGLFNVHQQSRITEGGVLGATLLLQHWLGISPAISEVVMDVACYLLGIKYLGKSFLRYSLVATGGFAVFYALFARMGYLLPSMAHLPLLAAVVGGLFVGLGVGLVVRAGGAAGGDDALALVIAKLFRWPVSRAYLFTDLVVSGSVLELYSRGKHCLLSVDGDAVLLRHRENSHIPPQQGLSHFPPAPQAAPEAKGHGPQDAAHQGHQQITHAPCPGCVAHKRPQQWLEPHANAQDQGQAKGQLAHLCPPHGPGIKVQPAAIHQPSDNDAQGGTQELPGRIHPMRVKKGITAGARRAPG